MPFSSLLFHGIKVRITKNGDEEYNVGMVFATTALSEIHCFLTYNYHVPGVFSPRHLHGLIAVSGMMGWYSDWHIACRSRTPKMTINGTRDEAIICQ